MNRRVKEDGRPRKAFPTKARSCRPDRVGINADAATKSKNKSTGLKTGHYMGRPENRRTRLAGYGFGDVLFAHGGAMIEEAASGEELGVEQGGASGTADQVV